ncbi:hypothetical protein HEK616_50000 [Streptomyces nigrescens]|uniref:Uncharacterized protein n=1 Tax=Streptomyces nigrescens TaxID=1920 RepID=A0ABN6R4L3_STRNI|nr:hypothetical protein HEK616_50000 [Streptomyces nigrescens]
MRPVTRLEALRVMAKESSRAAASTRARVVSDTVDRPRRVRETVDTETPARWATSAIVASLRAEDMAGR